MEHTIYTRRSIRKYQPKEVSKEQLLQILDAARVAPSGKNKQSWRFLVYGGAEKAALLAALARGLAREKNGEAFLPQSSAGVPSAEHTLRIMEEAPIVILVLNPDGRDLRQALSMEERTTELIDTLSAGAAIENMLLRAQELGLGTLWIGNTFFAYPELAAHLQTDALLLGAVAVGYAAEEPMARPRKQLDEIVEYHI